MRLALPSLKVRLLSLVAVAGVAATLTPLAERTLPQAFAGPVADSDALYAACGRAFPDPQAFWAPTVGESTPHPGSGTSPWAKGNATCQPRTFISYDDAMRGLRYLDSRPDTGKFLDVINLATTTDPTIREVLDEEFGDGKSEGVADATGALEKSDLMLVRVTAPEGAQLVPGVQPVPVKDRENFAWSLSVHGIERAGVEGGMRAIEDLVTWGANSPTRRILETEKSGTIKTIGGRDARNLQVGEVLMRSTSWFMLPNPDGWRRGDLDQAGASFARFNGNGMDLNRDFPEIGYVDPSFTPLSESESRTYGKVLKAVAPKWKGGIDMHGMVAAKAFSFTLIGGSQRPFDKNERTMQFVEQAWADAEKRLTWSATIKKNTEAPQCADTDGVGPNGETNPPPCDQRMYGVQYGTIWDTIDYTATGAIGNWIDSPIGLDADGIDNEMAVSHLGNCASGNCYLPEFEQLHVDGNKSLMYNMLNFSLQPLQSGFDVGGSDIGYFVNPRRLVDPGIAEKVAPPGVSAPADLSGTAAHTGTAPTTLTEFTVDNASGTTFTGGIAAEVRWLGVKGHSAGAADQVRLEHQAPGTTTWTRRPVYAPGAVYAIAGQRADWNRPADGKYRLIVTGSAPVQATWTVDFRAEPTFEAPEQAAFDVSNMDFFKELDPQMAAGSTLSAVTADAVLSGTRDLRDFDTVVVADDALLPGYREQGDPAGRGLLDLPATSYTAADRDAIASKLKDFVTAGGNLVLTDDGLRALKWMGIVPPAAVKRELVYAGAVAFTKDAAATDTYGDPLNKGINQPGSAENTNNRRQTAEPLPTGYALNNSHPQWYVDTAAWAAAGGRVAGTSGTGATSAARTTLGEVAVGAGRVRILGSLLPFPTTQFHHPYGLSSYGVTDPGFTLTRNMWTWTNPTQRPAPRRADDPVTWVASGVPTRTGV